jgi:hypothetical protein
MNTYDVMFNNGCWEDTVSFKTDANSAKEALENVLSKNPEYSFWNNFVN